MNQAQASPALHDLGLSVRTIGTLRCNGITTTQALLEKSADDLRAWPGFGLWHLRDVRQGLAAAGLALRDDPPPEGTSV